MSAVKFGAKFAHHFKRHEILVPHLNNWFARGAYPNEIPIHITPNKEQDDAFHPSSALKCSRELYASFRDELVPERHTAEAQKNFQIGHIYHSYLQWLVVDQLGFATWEDVEKEYDFSFTSELGNPYRVRGFIDIARCEVPSRGTYLVDIKTMNARIYAQDYPAVMPKYEAQVKLYLEFEELDEAIILCVEKDSPHRLKEVMVQRDPDLVAEIMGRWESIVDALAAEEPPPCTCSNPATCPARGIYTIDRSTTSAR